MGSHWQEEGVRELLAGNLFLVNIICTLRSHCCFAISNIPCHSCFLFFHYFQFNHLICFQCLKCSIKLRLLFMLLLSIGHLLVVHISVEGGQFRLRLALVLGLVLGLVGHDGRSPQRG